MCATARAMGSTLWLNLPGCEVTQGKNLRDRALTLVPAHALVASLGARATKPWGVSSGGCSCPHAPAFVAPRYATTPLGRVMESTPCNWSLCMCVRKCWANDTRRAVGLPVFRDFLKEGCRVRPTRPGPSTHSGHPQRECRGDWQQSKSLFHSVSVQSQACVVTSCMNHLRIGRLTVRSLAQGNSFGVSQRSVVLGVCGSVSFCDVRWSFPV